MSEVIQLIYASRAVGGPGDLEAILTVSRIRNAAADLTGYLLAGTGWFVQVLEGPRAVVEATYKRIAEDPRHAEMALLSERIVRRRSFPRWSMGCRTLDDGLRHLVERHGLAAGFEPRQTPVPMLLALAMDLQDLEVAA